MVTFFITSFLIKLHFLPSNLNLKVHETSFTDDDFNLFFRNILLNIFTFASSIFSGKQNLLDESKIIAAGSSRVLKLPSHLPKLTAKEYHSSLQLKSIKVGLTKHISNNNVAHFRFCEENFLKFNRGMKPR